MAMRSETARATGNRGWEPPLDGPVSGKLFGLAMELKVLAQRLGREDSERLTLLARAIVDETAQVATLEKLPRTILTVSCGHPEHKNPQ